MSNYYQIKYFDHYEAISNDWESIYSRSTLPYFCSLAWHRVVLEFLKKTLITKRRNKIKYFTASNGNEIQILGFFFIRTNKKRKTIIFGHLLGPSDYFDFIYSDKSDLLLNETLLQKIVEDHEATGFMINHVKIDSALFDTACKFRHIKIQAVECVSIQLPLKYEDYFDLLSKNAKQNLRTALNRLKRDNLTTEFFLYSKVEKDKLNFQKLKEIYLSRNRNKTETKNWKSKLYILLDSKFIGYPDMFDLKETMDTDFSVGQLLINGQLAAYFFGFNKGGFIEINRVAIVEDFKFYSPGILLFHKFIESCLSVGLKVVDLTVGGEKYKYDLGGKLHKAFNIRFEK